MENHAEASQLTQQLDNNQADARSDQMQQQLPVFVYKEESLEDLLQEGKQRYTSSYGTHSSLAHYASRPRSMSASCATPTLSLNLSNTPHTPSSNPEMFTSFTQNDVKRKHGTPANDYSFLKNEYQEFKAMSTFSKSADENDIATHNKWIDLTPDDFKVADTPPSISSSSSSASSHDSLTDIKNGKQLVCNGEPARRNNKRKIEDTFILNWRLR